MVQLNDKQFWWTIHTMMIVGVISLDGICTTEGSGSSEVQPSPSVASVVSNELPTNPHYKRISLR